MNTKDQIIALVKQVPVDSHWSGILNEQNVYGVAERMRLTFSGKVFAIASAQYVDSHQPELRLATDTRFSEWSDHEPGLVRVIESDKSRILGWMAGGYAWIYHAAPANTVDGDDYRIPHFSFNGDQMVITYRYPVSEGCLHKYAYKLQYENNPRT